MKLWKVERTDTVGWDQFDSFVVRAETEDEAKLVARRAAKAESQGWGSKNNIATPIELDGPAEVILGSFNAG